MLRKRTPVHTPPRSFGLRGCDREVAVAALGTSLFCAFSVFLATGPLVAHASLADAPSIYAQFERAGSRSDTTGLVLGVTAPIHFDASLPGTKVGAYWDLFAARLSASGPEGGHRLTTLIGLTPVFRFRFADGQSPWFADAGLGVSYSNRPYRSDVKEFSTRFNFGTGVGVGYSFGAAREQEVSLRFQHFSNGGYREPNPGENYLQLRYAHKF